MTNEPVTHASDATTAANPGGARSETRVPFKVVPGNLPDLPRHTPAPPRHSRPVRQRVPLVCARCDLINQVALESLDREACCAHCGEALFQGRVFDLQAANFDLHVHATHVPTAILFWAPWCKPCDAVLSLIERAARVLEPRIRFARVNIDQERELASRCGVRGIPTVLVFKHGRESARRIGYVDLQSVAGWANA